MVLDSLTDESLVMGCYYDQNVWKYMKHDYEVATSLLMKLRMKMKHLTIFMSCY